MNPPEITILQGNALTKLKGLPSESVHCVVTSPPYWGLRDYSACPCVQAASAEIYDSDDVSCGSRTPRYKREADPDCPKCNGTGKIIGVGSNQLGLEKTPVEYVAKLVEIFREVKRVLRSDGTVWLNLGDSYAGTGAGQVDTGKAVYGPESWPQNRPKLSNGLKPKDQCLIPHRVAIALQADGWWVRQTVIWNKNNPMPESCDDRCTSSHEYIFHLTKSGASTYWTHRDGLGSRTPPEPDYRWLEIDTKGNDTGVEANTPPEAWLKWRAIPRPKPPKKTPSERSCGWRRVNLWEGHDYFYDADAIREADNKPNGWVHAPESAPFFDSDDRGWSNTHQKTSNAQSSKSLHRQKGGIYHPIGRNKRSVWTMNIKPYTEAHFATFPPELPETCIKAGTSLKGCCPKCGAPWERVTERKSMVIDRSERTHSMGRTRTSGTMVSPPESKTTGWQPTCSCGIEDTIPCTVMDIFAGSGTTGEVARNLGRSSILIELNPEYIKMIKKRTMADMRSLHTFQKEEEE